MLKDYVCLVFIVGNQTLSIDIPLNSVVNFADFLDVHPVPGAGVDHFDLNHSLRNERVIVVR